MSLTEAQTIRPTTVVRAMYRQDHCSIHNVHANSAPDAVLINFHEGGIDFMHVDKSEFYHTFSCIMHWKPQWRTQNEEDRSRGVMGDCSLLATQNGTAIGTPSVCDHSSCGPSHGPIYKYCFIASTEPPVRGTTEFSCNYKKT